MATGGHDSHDVEFVPFPDDYNGLSVEPSDKTLLGLDSVGSKTKLKLHNEGQEPILFKVKCTSNERLSIVDCAGIIEAKKTASVTVKRIEKAKKSKDKICIVYLLLGAQGGDNALVEWKRATEQQIPTKNMILKVAS